MVFPKRELTPDFVRDNCVISIAFRVSQLPRSPDQGLRMVGSIQQRLERSLKSEERAQSTMRINLHPPPRRYVWLLAPLCTELGQIIKTRRLNNNHA